MSKIWIDLDNSPHVPLFRPIIRELELRGHSITLTARDCFQVRPLLELFHVDAKLIGRHYGKNKAMKLAGLMIRALELVPTAWRDKPVVALSHGSRSQIVVARLLGIKSILMADYEHVTWVPGFHPDWTIVPEVLLPAVEDRARAKVLAYRGIKEDVYVPGFGPDHSILPTLGIDSRKLIVTIRPPATEAHYHNPESEKLLDAVIRHFGNQESVQMVIIPRNERQATQLQSDWAGLIKTGRLIFPDHAVDGLNLIWFSDLVVSGGGTMNREAAALGVPVCTVFRGKLGAVDRYLSETGRLKLLASETDVLGLRPEKREPSKARIQVTRPALRDVIQDIEKILQERNPGDSRRQTKYVTESRASKTCCQSARCADSSTGQRIWQSLPLEPPACEDGCRHPS